MFCQLTINPIRYYLFTYKSSVTQFFLFTILATFFFLCRSQSDHASILIWLPTNYITIISYCNKIINQVPIVRNLIDYCMYYIVSSTFIFSSGVTCDLYKISFTSYLELYTVIIQKMHVWILCTH